MNCWIVRIIPIFCLVCVSLFCQSGEQRLKDILFIYTDDQAAYSDQILDVVMPNVNEWIKLRGENYTNYICSSPYCAPSRATVLTGMYPHNTGHHNNNTSYKKFYEKVGAETLGTWMQNAGYHTIFVGKYFNPNFPFSYDQNHVPEGWDDFLAMRSGKYIGTPYTSESFGKIIHRLIPKVFKRSDYEIKQLLNYLKAYASRHIDKPLFVYYAPFEPHTPQVGQQRPTMYGRDQVPTFKDDIESLKDQSEILSDIPQNRISLLEDRFKSLHSLDRNLLRLFQYLDSEKIYDDMYVFFGSDNGFLLGQNGLYGKRRHQDLSVNVPFYVKHPNDIYKNTTNNKLVGTVDLVSTFLDIGNQGIEADGESILNSERRKYIYAEMIETDDERPSWYMLRSDSLAIVEEEGSGYGCYDIKSDPYHQINLYDAEEHKALISMLEQSKLCKGDCP